MKHRTKSPPRYPKGAWWKTQTSEIGVINDYVNKFCWSIYVGNSPNSAIKDFSKKAKFPEWTIEEGRQYGHFAAYRPYKNGCIWFKEPYTHEPGILAHECFHGVSYLMEVLTVKQIEDTEELFAYYLEFLVREVYSLCLKVKR